MPPTVLEPKSPVAMAKVLASMVLNRDLDSPSRPQPMDMPIDEEKLAAMIRAERKMSGFGGGVRRESFPGKHSHTPDVSFNCEEAFIGDKTYSSDVTHDEGMSFVYNARSSTPVSAHDIPLPPTVQSTRSDPGVVVEPPSNATPKSGLEVSLSTPTLGLEGLNALSTTVPKLRTTYSPSPLAFEVDNETEGKDGFPSCEPDFFPPQRNNPSERIQLKSGPVPPVAGLKSISARTAALRFILPECSAKLNPCVVVEPPSNATPKSGLEISLSTPTIGLEGLNASSTTAPKLRTTYSPSPLAFEVDNETEGKDGFPSCEPDFFPPQRNNPSERVKLKSGPVPPMAGLKSISARTAALRFILPEDSLMEMDSILDVHEPQATKPRSATPEPSGAPQERESADSGQQGSPTTIEWNSQGGVGSTESNPAPHKANGSYFEDEHTLNLASLGLNGVGNTLLVDMSLDQLRSKSNQVEQGNATFGGSSFAIADSSATEWSAGAMLEAQTPKRTASNTLPHMEDIEMSVEATVRKPRSPSGWGFSDAVVDALRSGRALHRATNSIPSVSDTIRPTNSADGADERPIGKPTWPRSAASLRRTESFTSYSHSNTAEPRQYPGSAVPIQRTRSTMSLRRTSSVTSYQPDFMRPHSRTSVVNVDSDSDEPYTPPVPTVPRGSSRRSSIYALPEPGNPNDYPASYFERPGSVASIYDRPTSAASVRPTSAASIRPPSAASIRTSSTRPTSAASSLRSGSATTSRRVPGAHLQPSTVEGELAQGMETLMRGGMRKISPTLNARSAQEAQHVRSTKIAGVEGVATQDHRGTPRSGIRQLSGSSAAGTKPGLGPLKTLGTKILSGVPGSKHLIGPSTRSTAVGTGTAARTMSAASGRSMPMAVGSGTRSTTSTLRSQSSTQSSAVRPRATTLGLFAPNGGPGAGQEPKKPTHKASSASISATPSTSRILRPPATTSSIRTLGARGTNVTPGPARAAATAGSIASLREAMKSKETSKR
ncbi:hypothetical protein RSAG8_01234, partial [Rhizoctonia solani AG-8 WAC10335]